MKTILYLLGILYISATVGLHAQETNTKVLFKTPQETKEDKYGNNYFDREAVIETKNYKIKNFWSGFFQPEDIESNYANISRIGLFRITASSTSACTLDHTLIKEGCSGQKPFLINDEVLQNPMAGTDDTYEVVFKEAINYANNDYNAFYPLDVQRDTKYYLDIPQNNNQSNSRKGFFGFITNSIDWLFNKTVGVNFFGYKDIADTAESPRSDAAQNRRQRYIANIIAGIDKEHRLQKETKEDAATAINAPTLNTPPSLLHYAEAQKITQDKECKFMLLQLSNDGLMCRVMSGFGMDIWMPFFNKTKVSKVESSFIMADTENSLLAMTSQIKKVPYMQDVGGDEDKKLSILQNLLKPMKTMISFMKHMLFGESKKDIVSNPVERVYNYSDDTAMNLTFAVTNDGSIVNDFASFKLMKIRSVYGDMIESCHVKKSPGFLSPYHFDKTFYIGGNESARSPNYTIFNKEIWDSDQWVDWCQKATGRKGMFDYLFHWKTGAFFNPFNWMRGFFSMFLTFFTGSYDIVDFSNTLKRGLILELKRTVLNPVSTLTTREIKVLKITSPAKAHANNANNANGNQGGI
jgi:hypothetical protein